MVDAKSHKLWMLVIVVLAVLTISVIVAVLLVRSLRTGGTEENTPAPPTQPQVMERRTDATPFNQDRRSNGEDDGARSIEAAGRPVVTPLRDGAVPEDIWDVTRSVTLRHADGGPDAAVVPRSAVTGAAISRVDAADDSPAIVTTAEFFLQSDVADTVVGEELRANGIQHIPVDDAYGDFIHERLWEVRDRFGQATDIYRQSGEPVSLIMRNTRELWGQLWLTVEDDNLIDIEFSFITDEGGVFKSGTE